MSALCPLRPGPWSRRKPNAFFGLTAGWWLLFTSSGTCINALLLNMSSFALLLFSLIRADDSCSPLSTVNGSRASLAPLSGNKLLRCGCSSCACQASSVQLSSLFNTNLHDFWLQAVGLIWKMEQLWVYVPYNPWHLPLLLVLPYETSVSTLGKGVGKRHIFLLATVGAGNAWPEVKVYFL